MSARSKLAGKFTGDEDTNGVDYVAEEMCDRWDAGDPENPPALLVTGVLRVRSYQMVRNEDGARVRVPTYEVVRMEALGVVGRDGTDSLEVAPAMDRQRLLDVAEKRTHATPLPLEAASAVENHQVL